MENRVAALLRDGQVAARAGEQAKARRKFRAALISDPTNIPALLWLAWLSDDSRAGLAYIVRALACDPRNPRAHAALRWARHRVTSPAPPKPPPWPTSTVTVSHWRRIRNQVFGKKSSFLIVLGLLVILIGSIFAWSPLSDLPALAALVAISSPTATITASPTSTHTPTPTSTHTPTPTFTPTPTPTSTLTPTLTLTPTPTHPHTPTPIPTPTPLPALPTAPSLPPPATLSPSSIHGNVHWIDVDLAHQTITAYEGQTAVRTTLISTGLPRTPTPVGLYRIYLKLRYDDMSGPGYYLPDVPYTMYFYRGYGLHGTYWHSNFGHPMSHGCVNLPTPEAEWLFGWAEVGTLVNVHW